MSATRPTAEVLIDRTRRWPGWERWLIATALVALAALLREVFDPLLAGDDYFLFLFAVVVSGLFLNHASSILATALSAAVIAYIFVEPRFSFTISRSEAGGLTLFVLVCLLVGVASEAVRKLAERLQEERAAKETLYQELRHRIANNLQIIGATLALQAARSTAPEVHDTLKAVGDRIGGIARVDQLLHASVVSGQQVDSCAYLKRLCTDITTALVAQRPISLACEAERTTISPDVAEALGVAVNELVTNAVKYAFDGEPGHIAVRFHGGEDGMRLTVEDNGKGCAKDTVSGTGWKLIKSLIGRHRGRMWTEAAQPGCRVIIFIPQAEGRNA
jgi:two-component sensor histidine kinase